MRTTHVHHAVDSHTEGMPTRVITGGVPPIPGTTMAERRLWFAEHRDGLRKLLMREPRGHGAMSGAILQPPTRPDADWGVLYIEVSGLLPMCGHGTIGVATVLVETGMVEVTEPVTTLRLDTPAGLVVAEVAVRDGRAESVTLTNVPSFLVRRDAHIDVPGLGVVPYDLGFGGNFYAFVELADLALPFDRREKDRLLSAGLALMETLNAEDEPIHPSARTSAASNTYPPLRLGRDALPPRDGHPPGWFDRSPAAPGPAPAWRSCARGELLGIDFVNESFIGSRFVGRLAGTARVGEHEYRP